MGVQEIPCRVCSAPSSGFHFGALTCEGCKGFFRRMVKEREAYSYKCNRNGRCEVSAMTRNMCKACRYNKCIQIGMSVEGSRIGRQPNAVKYAISLEARKQAALKVEPGGDNGGNTDSSSSNINFDSVILQPCIPGEMDDSVQSVVLSQVSSSVDAYKSTSRELEEVKTEREPFLPYCPDTRVLNGIEQHISSAASVHRSDFLRHHVPPSYLDHHRLIQNPYSSNLNSSSMSVSIHRNLKPQILRRSHIEEFDSSSNTQPQDLSIDLSIPRPSTASSGHITSHNSLFTSSTLDLSSPSVHPPSTPVSSSVNLSSPSQQSPSSPHYCQTAYSYQDQQNVHFISNFDQDKHSRPVQHSEHCRGSTPVYNIDSHSSYHSNAQNVRHIPQQEVFISSLHAPNSHPHILGSQFSSPFHDCNSPPFILQEQHQTSHYHQLRLKPLQEPQLFPARQNSIDEMCSHPTDHQVYASQLKRGDIYRGSPNLHSFHDRPQPPHDLKLSQQQWSPSQPSVLPPPSSAYVSPHFSPPSPVLTVAPSPSKELSFIPEVSQNTDIPTPLSSMPDPGKVTAAGNQNDLNISNEELHGIVLDAARNLAHFCLVNRAKSDVFDAERFKNVDSTWEKMMEHFNFHAKSIVRFAKRVPGFRSLKIDDQVLLLRMATYSLVILNHSRSYEPDTGFYNYFNFTQQEIQMITERFPEFDVIHTHYKHTGIMAQRHGLTEMEYAYLSCMLLLNDEYPGLENTERAKELKERYIEAFQDYEIAHFPKGSLRFGEMLLRLSEFSQFSVQHNIAVGLVITKNPQLHIPQLYAEMYTQNNSATDNSDSGNDEQISEAHECVKPPVVDGNK